MNRSNIIIVKLKIESRQTGTQPNQTEILNHRRKGRTKAHERVKSLRRGWRKTQAAACKGAASTRWTNKPKTPIRSHKNQRTKPKSSNPKAIGDYPMKGSKQSTHRQIFFQNPKFSNGSLPFFFSDNLTVIGEHSQVDASP